MQIEQISFTMDYKTKILATIFFFFNNDNTENNGMAAVEGRKAYHSIVHSQFHKSLNFQQHIRYHFFQNSFIAKIIHLIREKSVDADSSVFNSSFNKESN